MAEARPALFASGLALLGSLVLPPSIGAAESILGRAGDAVGGFFRQIVDFIVPDGRRADDLDRALETYEKGFYFTTYVHAKALLERDEAWIRDEADLLVGLAAAEAGLREEAVPRLRAVLEADPVSPYYPVALASLLELEHRFENWKAASAAAADHLADFWRRPRTAREAAIKAVFLETGNFVSERESDGPTVAGDRLTRRLEDRITDRAVYLAGLALLRNKDFEGATVCFDALTERSPYYAFARYGFAQASYGLGKFPRAKQALRDILAGTGERAGESFVQDRAALLLAQIHHELDEDAAAIRRLRNVSSNGPFALHAALLAAEIQAEREEPALALVYLQERPAERVEPKLVAQAAALDASLHRDLADGETAVTRLEEGIRTLDGYAKSLAAAAGAAPRRERLLRPLESSQESRQRVDAWRRQNVSRAVPDLLRGASGAGWGSRTIASLLADPENGHPVVYHRKRVDPFTALPPPREASAEPPGDRAFPSLFRRSLGHALSDALRHEVEVREAMDGDDFVQLALLLLDGEIVLRAAGAQDEEDDRILERIAPLGFSEEVIFMVRDDRPREEILLAAVRSFDAEQAPADVTRVARAQLERWEARKHDLVRGAVRAETKTVQELRYALEFELSETLEWRRGERDRILQGSAPTSAIEPRPAG